MWRSAIAVSACVGLTACGDGNPFIPVEDTTMANVTVNGTEFGSSFPATSISYQDNGTVDVSDDRLLVNNLAFDNTDESGGGYVKTRDLPGGFGLYESPLIGLPRERQYFAVFKRTANAQAAAIATNDYIGFGFGGLVAERLTDGGIPAARASQYLFTGQYAGIRIYRSSTQGGNFTTVSGDARLNVDILDFDTTGAVEGVINNRTVYNFDGSAITNLNDFVSLATAEIVTENASISSSTSAGVARSTNSVITNGQWTGVFAGPNGEEVAGIVFVEGTATPEEQALTDANGNLVFGSDATVRESGAFIVFNGG